MAQTYPDIPATKAVRDSRQDILDRDEAVRSAFSGTTFPSANLVVGMFCFRTDLGHIYELTATSPVTWTRIPLGVPVPLAQGGTGAPDAATARANLGLAALAVKNTVAAADIDNAAVQTAKLQDASVTTAKIADGQVTTTKLADGQVTTAKLGDAQVTTVKLADSAITSAKIADGTIATADLAAQTIADIRAGVDISSRVAKSGDTMTGALTAPGFVSTGNIRSGATGDNARATGFVVADGTDIGELNRSNQYYDDRIANCRGNVPNGNCQGNTSWQPPNQNWWTWGISGVSTGLCNNYAGYDFAGGQSSSYYSTTQIALIYDSYSLAADEIGGAEYRRNYNNCNCSSGWNSVGNCYTNCNCNCACACSTDSSCLTWGTQILMGDSTVKSIEHLQPGDVVMVAPGQTDTVVCLHQIRLGKRQLVSIGGLLFGSADHPMQAENGDGQAFDPEAYARTLTSDVEDVLPDGRVVMSHYNVPAARMSAMRGTARLVRFDGEIVPLEITTLDGRYDRIRLYAPVLSKSNTFIANGLVSYALVAKAGR